MPETRKYDLEELEHQYRQFTTHGDAEAAQRMRTIIASIRYDLSNDHDVHMEYRSGLETPLLMRILRTEKDLERWIEQRFVRLGELS